MPTTSRSRTNSRCTARSWSARDATGPLEIRVLGRDEADAQLLARFWRFLLYKEGGTQIHLTRLEDVEHDGFALLLAARAGVRVPELVVAGSAGPDTALGAFRPLDGPRSTTLDPAAIDRRPARRDLGAGARSSTMHGSRTAR